MFRKPFTVLVVAAIVVAGLLVAKTDARVWPPPEAEVKAPKGPTGASTCQTPVEFAQFLRGLDVDESVAYKNGQLGLVYDDKSLRCKARGMPVVFRISDIGDLRLVTVTTDMIEKSVLDLPTNDPVRVEAEAQIGVTYLGIGLKIGVLGKLVTRKVGGKRVSRQAVGAGLTVVTQPYVPLPGLLRSIAEAYQAGRTSATVWARVTWAAAIPAAPSGRPPGAAIELEPYKLEG